MDMPVGRKRLSHWLLRVYLASAAVAAVLAGAGGPRPPFWLEFALLAPLFPAVLLAFDVCAFRFAHSSLGPYRRSPLPRGGPVLTRWLRAGRIGLECAAARREIAEFIREGGPRVEVLIDGKPLPSGADLLPLLADMETGLSSSLVTERRFPAELRTGPRSITFVMARKRGDPTRYAVYQPARAGTRMNPIGHVRTHLLDAVPSGLK